MPLLFDIRTGLPLFAPLIFVLTLHRQINNSSSTMERALREISVLLTFLDQRGIDLQARLYDGVFLTNNEIDGLVAHSRQSIASALTLAKHLPNIRSPRFKKSNISYLRVKNDSTDEVNLVGGETSANRLRTIASYLDWLADDYLADGRLTQKIRQDLTKLKSEVIKKLRARIPSDRERDADDKREGLGPDVVMRMLEVSDPNSKSNPWNSPHCRMRNFLAINWLLNLGLRRGELHLIRISDIDLRRQIVKIPRRPDDPEETRSVEPRTKGNARAVPIGSELAKLTLQYITEFRTHFNGSRKHEVLLVADRTGDPLSLAATNKMFRTLRASVPGLPDDLTPHVLRHTWNDHFSKNADKKNLSEEDEKKMRSYLMGWKYNSEMAAVYTRRHIRETATKASLDMQKTMMENFE